MSAIKLYTSKIDALYFKDSQRNRFYEFGGIQLLPYNYYLQPYTYSNTITKVESFRSRDDVLLNDLSLYIQATVGYGIKFSRNTVMPFDYGNELIYLRFTHSGGYFYSNPFYYTALDEDKTTLIGYRDNFVDDLYFVSLKVWFRQKSRQSELTTYYETKTKNTVTQAIKSHDLEMYESEFMSMEDLIMTTDILESPVLVINGSVCSLFEAIKLPDLTQQENFGKIKFIINAIENPSIITNGLVLNLDAGNTLSYPGTGTIWNDLSKYSNDGTLINSPTFNSSNGGSIVFDGIDDYVVTPTVNLNSFEFTMNMWFKYSSISTTEKRFLLDFRGTTANNSLFIYITPSNKLIVDDRDGALTSDISAIESTSTIASNTWINLSVKVNRSLTGGNEDNIYINGVLFASTYLNSNNLNIPYASNPFYIGNNSLFNSPYKGNIASVQVYNRALLEEEILQNFNSTKSRYGL